MIYTVTVNLLLIQKVQLRSNSLVEFEGMQLLSVIVCVAAVMVLPEQSVATPSPILISKCLFVSTNFDQELLITR